mmetsp:Transcript_3390/g.5021  ORF Transcript_3390/g.5021 Transcript_3390/m.5021 type:complete len:190 (+) Transcript_3390:45-614(+)
MMKAAPKGCKAAAAKSTFSSKLKMRHCLRDIAAKVIASKAKNGGRAPKGFSKKLLQEGQKLFPSLKMNMIKYQLQKVKLISAPTSTQQVNGDPACNSNDDDNNSSKDDSYYSSLLHREKSWPSQSNISLSLENTRPVTSEEESTNWQTVATDDSGESAAYHVMLGARGRFTQMMQVTPLNLTKLYHYCS